MAIAQDTFQNLHLSAYEGQQSTIDVNDVLSRRNDGDSVILFGRAVVRSDNDPRSGAPFASDSTADDVIGIAVRSLAVANTQNWYPQNSSTDFTTGYQPGSHASVLRRGRVFATCVDGADAGEAVSVVASGDDIGRLTGSSGDVPLNQVRWTEDVEAGEIGEIQLDGILNVESGSSNSGDSDSSDDSGSTDDSGDTSDSGNS